MCHLDFRGADDQLDRQIMSEPCVTMRRCLLLTIAVPVLLLSPLSSHAQPDLSPLQRPSRPMMEAAQQHFRSGTRFYEEGSWDAALVEFEASWRLSGEADLLHNISWTHEKAGRTREALDYAERYLSASRGTEDEERAAKRVAFLKERYGGGAAAPDNFLHSVSGASALFEPYAAEVADLRMLVRSVISSSTCEDENSPSGPFGLTSVKGDS